MFTRDPVGVESAVANFCAQHGRCDGVADQFCGLRRGVKLRDAHHSSTLTTVPSIFLRKPEPLLPGIGLFFLAIPA